jgi:hypothetical protein
MLNLVFFFFHEGTRRKDFVFFLLFVVKDNALFFDIPKAPKQGVLGSWWWLKKTQDFIRGEGLFRIQQRQACFR